MVWLFNQALICLQGGYFLQEKSIFLSHSEQYLKEIKKFA
jgi:hypothetical protein